MKTLGYAVMALVSLICAPVFAQEVKWDLSIEQTAGTIPGRTDMHFADLVRSKTNGSLDISIHFSGSLGYKSWDHFEATETGAIQIASTPQSQMGGISAIFETQGLPFVQANIEEARKLDATLRPYYEAIFGEAGQMLLYTAPWTPQGMWASRPVLSAGDMSSLSVRTVDRYATQTISNAGAKALTLSWGDVPGAISTGTINAVLTSAEGGDSIKIWELGLNHFTELNYTLNVQLVHMNKAAFDSLSDEQQAAILAAAKEAGDFGWELGRQRNKEINDAIAAAGVIVHSDVSAEFLAQLRTAAAPVLEEWVKRTEPQGAEILEKYDAQKGAL